MRTAILFLLLAVPCMAQQKEYEPMKAGMLAKGCRPVAMGMNDKQVTVDTLVCITTVIAWRDMIDHMVVSDYGGVVYILPKDVSNLTIIQTFIQFVNRNPIVKDADALGILMQSLRESKILIDLTPLKRVP